MYEGVPIGVRPGCPQSLRLRWVGLPYFMIPH